MPVLRMIIVDTPQVKGRNRQGCPVFFVGDIDELKGHLVPVRITEAGTYYLVGQREDSKVNAFKLNSSRI